jgi:hypothetical protein
LGNQAAMELLSISVRCCGGGGERGAFFSGQRYPKAGKRGQLCTMLEYDRGSYPISHWVGVEQRERERKGERETIVEDNSNKSICLKV